MNNGYNRNMNGYPGRMPNGAPQYPNQQPGYMNGPVPPVPPPTPNKQSGAPSVFDSSYNENLAKLDKEIEESKKADKKLFMILGGVGALFVIGVVVSVIVNSITHGVQNMEEQKKSDLINIANLYVNNTKMLVEGSTLSKVTDGNLLILIPVGNDSSVSCTLLEAGGASPYNSTWKMAFVGVIYNYDNQMFDYYFTGVDGSGNGIAFVQDLEISNGDTAIVSNELGEYAKGLQSIYQSGKNHAKAAPSKYGDMDLNDFATNVGASNVAVLSISDCNKLKG